MRTGTSLMLGQERGMFQPRAACQSLQTLQVIYKGICSHVIKSLGYGLEDWRIRVGILWLEKSFLLPPLLDEFWGPSSLLSKEYWGLFLQE
jgi:hypothetical protein